MEMKKMKVGLTIQVSPSLRALFREAAEKVEVQALVSRQTFTKAEMWGWDLSPSHLSFATANVPTLAFGEDGPATLADDLPLGAFTVQGLALEVIRHFLAEKEGERIALHLGPSSLGLMDYYLGDAPFPEDLEVVATAHGHGGYTKVRVGADGGIYVKESWGSDEYWDAWAVSPDGAVEYMGTVDGPRYLPIWLSRALEEAKAKGA